MRTQLRVCCLLAICSALHVIRADDSCILIKGGTVVNADHTQRADVLIHRDIIVDVRADADAAKYCQVVDATGKLVMPGGIDPHTHLSMPMSIGHSCDDFYSGQAAALAGGTTMHIDFVLPVNGSISAGMRVYKGLAERACMDYGFHVAMTAWNDDVKHDMAAAVAEGVNSFKFFMAYKDLIMVDDEQMLAGLRRCRELGAIAMVHGENGEAVAEGQRWVTEELGVTAPHGHALSRPAMLEGEATGRAARLARFAGVPLYVVHVMSEDAMREVAAARLQGQRIVGEAVTSGLALDESAMWHPDFDTAAKYVMSPPIRSVEHQAALRGALAGGALQLVGTDHAVWNSTQKRHGRHDFRRVPNGVNGIEERLHVVWHTMVNGGFMGPQQFVDAVSTQAAKIFNLYPRKGLIAPGSDADVIVFDPAAEHTISAATHHSAMDTNVYEGMRVRGRVTSTISRGRLIWHDGRLTATPGTGRFVRMEPGGSLYEAIERGESKPAWLRDLQRRYEVTAPPPPPAAPSDKLREDL